MKIYYLHIPKSGGSSAFHSLKNEYKFKNNILNGNWIDEYKKRIRFWELEEDEQIKCFEDVDILFNENELGDFFYPEKVIYILVLRNPIDILISMLQNAFITKDQNNFRHEKKNIYILEFNKFFNEEINKQKYRNYLLKFFYKFSEKNSDKLLKVAEERMKKFNIINFENITKDFNSVFKKIDNKDINLVHCHKRYGDPIKFEDLNEDNKIKIQEILKEDIMFFDKFTKN